MYYYVPNVHQIQCPDQMVREYLYARRDNVNLSTYTHEFSSRLNFRLYFFWTEFSSIAEHLSKAELSSMPDVAGTGIPRFTLIMWGHKN